MFCFGGPPDESFKKWNQKSFDDTAQFYDNQRNSYLMRERAKIIMSHLYGDFLLDVGVNTGRLLSLFTDGEQHMEILGIDI